MIPVYWLWNKEGDFWDWGLITELFQRSGHEFKHHHKNSVKPGEFGIVVVPGANTNAEIVNKEIAKLDSCLVIVTSDEARLFHVEQLTHPNMKLWLGYRTEGDKHDVVLPLGAPIGFKPIISMPIIPYYFSGQVTQGSRYELETAMSELEGAVFKKTDGFAKGDKNLYIREMGMSKLAPAPHGTVHPDSFRLYEALESGALPIVQADPYWESLEFDVPKVDTWDDLAVTARILTERFYRMSNEYAFSWQMHKRNLRRKLEAHIFDLTGQRPPNQITVLLPTSPIPTHPDTSIIEETINSVRERLPDAEILVLADGVRAEQIKLIDRYEEYQRNLLRLSTQLGFSVMRFEDHSHQAIMTREALKVVDTPTILYMEHDAPLCEDIPFDKILPVLESELDIVRFHHESHVLEPHQHLSRGVLNYNGVTYQSTIQWSQRPHLANTEYYRRILDTHFPPDRKTMIEDTMHGIVQSGDDVPEDWGVHRIGIYDPGDGNLKRSYHTDGRGNEPKFEETF